ncbi:non-canonical purine NTP diphosphatase [Flavicella sp.]|uniref:non-canonical purine NTP diphosphatase n=1 Tax=Flavicella sp. TaxID=2957742 RepID=UPI00301B3FEF
MKIVFATHNKNKIKEVAALLPTVELLSLESLKCYDEIEETAMTLEGNAKIKADYITNRFELNCFADDTGLEVEALDGVPGVYSARYAGEEGGAEKNMTKLLLALKDNPNRKAQFRTVIILNLNGEQHLFEGICMGTILNKKYGSKGFGYDPIFQPKGYSVSFAEMSMEEKGKISHRGLAISKLIAFLNKL